MTAVNEVPVREAVGVFKTPKPSRTPSMSCSAPGSIAPS